MSDKTEQTCSNCERFGNDYCPHCLEDPDWRRGRYHYWQESKQHAIARLKAAIADLQAELEDEMK